MSSPLCFFAVRTTMAKDRFVQNLFPDLELSVADKAELQALVSTFIEEHLPNYKEYCANKSRQVDANRWKLFKTKDNVRLHSERDSKDKHSTKGEEHDVSNLPVILCEGAIPGKLEDVMFGVISPTLELMRLKASYIDDISSASVLSTIVKPTPEDPLQSLVLKWMQLDLPLRSTSLVKNRDFVYMEATGILRTKDGERIGYHIQHSIGLPQAPELPNLVRGNCHLCAFFRQDRDLSVEIYATGACDPGGPVLKSLLLHPIASMLLSCTDYAHCGEMKKLAWIMQHRNAQKKQMGTKRNDDKCVSCSSSVSHSRIGKLSTTRGSCKLCFNAVCRSCRVRKLLTFMEPDLKYEKRKVTFCPVCIKDALEVSALQVARDQTLAPKRLGGYRSNSEFSATSSSDE
ncbi:hypothetical protein F441_14790 [Phytophthora nicotianae CJ01A1]|uniref:FYVE-type domain-containing protein n=7 Tax=Phytophthora nicotianae TaxID=4792 RepID=W2PV00_PHYN3|nr:hypothetical protein PPTG_15411 [Phytophthora nicotianae INRA-310]ETI39455.1 hypothetical protein F443_14981 [Phytophthora nicotianae P1569]ETL33054.1 hypothetical protein L916_14451 [Phytophthora nicotianae]ETP09344.1 hypothetical protein F441_14790 [Phytophthora nicotianae CJ01A1]ETP37373.1 hypothetical protein F442_14816 [Phytophthora nicotianae P10297]ETL86305.1 hypothetical protein L917_14269 [Phytophthora nicotianae]